MIRVSVRRKEGGFHIWWINFHKHYENLGFNMGSPIAQNKALLEWNATNIKKTEFIEFKNEQDYLLFMLRWS